MSIYDITRDDIETFTVVANPIRSFTTSSAGSSGGVFVFARRSHSEKEQAPSTAFVDATHDDSDLASALTAVQEAGFTARQASGSFFPQIDSYLTKVTQQVVSPRVRTSIDVVREVPSSTLGPSLLNKLNAKDLLGPWHRPSCPSADWSFANYHSLNFFTASTVDPESAYFYANIAGGPAHDGYVTGVYALSGAFTFDFSINPRYQPDADNRAFRAGTIYHMSSSYALSLVSGSARDQNGRTVGFRLQLQLSHSADIRPSEALHGAYPHDLVFLSDDNALTHNTWHRCIVRWGTQYVNDGTGSFNIDGVDRGTFVVPSGTIAPRTFPLHGKEGPSHLFIGNFMEGTNSGSNAVAAVFGETISSAFGVTKLWTQDTFPPAIDVDFLHPLQAELHDISLWRSYRTDVDIAVSGAIAPAQLGADAAFYVTPFFRQYSPIRKRVSQYAGGPIDPPVGGVYISPYEGHDGTTEDPANALMALSVDGHRVNLENFVFDVASGVHPFAFGTVKIGAVSPPPSGARTANDVLYNMTTTCRRNLAVLPCDDGAWVPNFDLIGSCLTGSRHADGAGRPDSSLVSLVGLVSTSSLMFGPVTDDASGSQEALVTSMLGITPDAYGAALGPALVSKFAEITKALDAGTYTPGMHRDVPTFVYHRTRDRSASHVVMFDVSNIFYGTRILPGTLILSEPVSTGSSGLYGITLRDDGQGGIFRADCASAWATWASVGTVFYEEGLIVIRSPLLAMFGKDGFDVSFRGERRVHVMRIDAVAPANQLNSSSNPAYKSLPPSGYANDPDSSFVYVTGINFHDENLNVVARTQLAQPIVKRAGDRIMFKTKIDW